MSNSISRNRWSLLAYRALGLICASYFMDVSHSLLAQPKEAIYFLESLEKSPYDFPFLQHGLKSVDRITFNANTNPSFSSIFNQMVLNAEMKKADGTIGRLEDLNSGDMDTIAHESFHAYKYHYIDYGSELKRQRKWMKMRSQIVFSSIPESKREVAMEEAYAQFIGSMFSSMVWVSKMVSEKAITSCDYRLKHARRAWAARWKDTISGYYYRDSYFEFWGDAIKGLLVRALEGEEAYRSFKGEGVVYVADEINDIDRRWISKNIFSSVLSQDFDETMARVFGSRYVCDS